MAMEEKPLRGASGMAKLMALICFEDSRLGRLKEGLGPVTRTGDYSDVVVVDADGRIIPWQRVARLDAEEMRRTRREIVNRLYTWLRNLESPALLELSSHRREETSERDRPREDAVLKKQMEALASGVVETVKTSPATGTTTPG